MKVTEILKAHINDAHGEGYDTIELPIDDARSILAKLEQAEKALEKMHHILASIDEKDDSIGRKSDGFYFIRTTLEKIRED